MAKGLRATEAKIAVALALAVSLLRIWLARRLSFCGTPDACYYLGMAQNLASGRGFQARFIYDFQQAHLSLPNTGIEYWRPGVSLLLLVLKPFHAVTLHGSTDLTVLVAVVFAAAAWHIAMQAFDDRRLALASFALCLVSDPIWGGSLTPDSGLYYGAAVAWFLALFTVRRQGLVQDLLALLCVCMAYLVRNDAGLLLLPLVAVLWQRHRSARAVAGFPTQTAEGATERGSSGLYAACMLLGFFLALVPMHLLYRAVLGKAFPSGTAQVFFLNDLGDFTRYNDPVSLHTLLSHGWKHFVAFRITTLLTVVYRIAVLMVGYPALILLGTRAAGRSAEAGLSSEAEIPGRGLDYTGPVLFAVTVLVVYSLILPAVGGFSALRSAVALMPLISVVTLVAIVRVARTPRLALALALGLIGAEALSGVMSDRRDVPAGNAVGDADRHAARQLASLGADPATAVVLTGDPVQFSVTTGYATVALPGNGPDAIAQAARDFKVTHVMLDSENLPESSADLYRRLHPVRSVVLPAEHTLILALPPDPGDRGIQ